MEEGTCSVVVPKDDLPAPEEHGALPPVLTTKEPAPSGLIAITASHCTPVVEEIDPARTMTLHAQLQPVFAGPVKAARIHTLLLRHAQVVYGNTENYDHACTRSD